MREILFRGKRLDNGEWMYGSYLQVEDKSGCVVSAIFHRKFEDGDAEIFPSTVGQYTGLRDKNGKRIFEGDIVSLTKWSNMKFSVDCSNCSFKLRDGKGTVCFALSIYKPSDIKVIGNIYDNPELLKEKR